MNQQLLTVQEVQVQLRLGRTTVYRLIQSRELASVKIGRRVLITAEALKSFLEQKTVGKPEPSWQQSQTDGQQR